MSYATARRRDANSEINKLYSEDRAIHDWYRFVLSFPPHLVRDYLSRFGVEKRQLVLDPFCGTGTTLLECKKLDVPSVGIEANTMAQFASRVKLDWSPDPDALLAHARGVASEALSQLEIDGVDDDPALRPVAHPVHGLRALVPETEKLLLTGSISPLPLHKVLLLLECLDRHNTDAYSDHERLALAKALVYSVGNLHFGPEVGVRPAKADAPVIAVWLNNVRAMTDDLRAARRSVKAAATVHLGDARSILDYLGPNTVDVVVTSPPYPNEKDYTRTTRLESVLLGFIRNNTELRALKRGLVRSNTRGVYESDDDDQWVTDDPTVQRIAEAIEDRRLALGKTSGFERLYARVTKLYFGGMRRHLANLRPALRPGARLAYVVGDQASYLRVMIRTGQILGDIAQALGYELVGIDLFRTRLATATREQLREEVVVLRWPG